jgi:hypothetical protein
VRAQWHATGVSSDPRFFDVAGFHPILFCSNIDLYIAAIRYGARNMGTADSFDIVRSRRRQDRSQRHREES